MNINVFLNLFFTPLLLGLLSCNDSQFGSRESKKSPAIQAEIPEHESDAGRQKPVIHDSSINGENSNPIINSRPITYYELIPSPSNRLKLIATIRDFSEAHPDFEPDLGDGAVRGIVRNTLGSDNKPVYADPVKNDSITSAETFRQWWHNDPVHNVEQRYEINLTKDYGNNYSYKSSAFFPIDGRGFGNQGRDHNFHFTMEISSQFTFTGDEKFEFSGDDDLWVFINRKLAVDIGGIHGEESQVIYLKEMKKKLGIEEGGTYSFHLFYAERHTPASNFKITTGIRFSNNPAYKYLIEATDPDGDELSYHLLEGPPGMVVNQHTGLLLWQAIDYSIAYGSEESVRVVVEVRDGRGGSEIQEFSLVVSQDSKKAI